jgi:hypothetical protein
MFFSGRGGGGKRKRQDTFSRVGFRWMMRAFKQPHFSMLYIIYCCLCECQFSGTLRFFSRTRAGIQINMNDNLRTRLSLISLRCSRLDTGETRIHIKGFLRAHLRYYNLLDAGGNLISNNDESRSYLRGEELRELRREFLTTLLSLYLLGREFSSEFSSNSGILKLNNEFSSGLGLRNVLPASEDDVMQMLRRISSATSTILDELRRGSLRLRCGPEFVVDLSLHIQQARRRRLLELEFKRTADLQIAYPPRAPRSLLSTSTSICHRPMVLPDLGADSVESVTQGMYSLRGITGACELPKRLNDQNGWKRLHDALAVENAGLSSPEWRR